MPVAIKGTGGGSVTLSSGAAAADTTLTLPNTTGTVALIASPTFSGTLTATTITSPASTALTIQSAGTTAMTVDTSQNVGIGTSSPSNKLHVAGAGVFTGTIANNIAGTYAFYNSSLSYFGAWGPNASTNGTTVFYSARSDGSNGLETMRIDSSGNLLVGTTSTSSPGGGIVFIPNASGTVGYGRIGHASGAGSGSGYFDFLYNNGIIGSITQNGTTAVAFNTSSDYRLKENVQPMTDGLAIVSALKPVRYDWISDKSVGEGFIAHELAEVVPLAVTGEKNAVNENGSIKPQGVDYSKIVVHLVAAIQELSAKNDALEARLAKLEAK